MALRESTIALPESMIPLPESIRIYRCLPRRLNKR